MQKSRGGSAPVTMGLPEYQILVLSHVFLKTINKIQKTVSNFHLFFSLFIAVTFASYCKVANCKTQIHNSTCRLDHQNLLKSCFIVHYSCNYYFTITQFKRSFFVNYNCNCCLALLRIILVNAPNLTLTLSNLNV